MSCGLHCRRTPIFAAFWSNAQEVEAMEEHKAEALAARAPVPGRASTAEAAQSPAQLSAPRKLHRRRRLA